MLDFDRTVRSQRKWMLYLLAVLFLGAGFTPYPRMFLGLILGTSASFYNLWLLQRKVKILGQAATDNKIKAGSLGTLSRIASSILVVFIAMRYEETFNVYAVVVGLATSYVVMVLDVFVRSIIDARDYDEKRKIEKR